MIIGTTNVIFLISRFRHTLKENLKSYTKVIKFQGAQILTHLIEQHHNDFNLI